MVPQFVIWVFLLLGFCSLIYFFWQSQNSKGYKVRQTNIRPKQRTVTYTNTRRDDNRKLTKTEKKLYKQAKKLATQKKHIQSARVLEQILFHREAIQLLEDNGFIDEAAMILMRMNRVNRAGVLFARNNYWEKALDCFSKEKMYSEAAKCALELKRYIIAGDYYSIASNFDSAAKCYVKSGDNLKASNAYLAASNFRFALTYIDKVGLTSTHIKDLCLNRQSLAFISDYLQKNNLKKGLVLVLKEFKTHIECLQRMISSAQINKSNEFYQIIAENIGLLLIGNFKDDKKKLQNLAKLFLLQDNHECAGIVYEKLQEFKKAGQSFEKANMSDRAIYCFERAGESVKANSIKATQNTRTETNGIVNNPAKKHESKSNRFSLISHKNSVEENEIKLSQVNFNQVKFLEGLTAEQKESLWEIGVHKKYAKNENLLNYGDISQGAYIVITGQVLYYSMDNSGEEKLLGVLNNKDLFGELWLLSDKESSIKFTANENTTILLIARSSFTNLLDKNDDIAKVLYKQFSEVLMNRVLNPRESNNKDSKNLPKSA